MKENMNYIRGKIAERRGEDSENRVDLVLRTHAASVEVVKGSKWDGDDMAGIDARMKVAHVTESGEEEIREVKVQVKSSERGVRSFYKKHADIAAETIVVIGQRSYTDIRKSIDAQLENMGLVFSKPESFREPAPGEEVQVFPSPIPENNLVQFPQRPAQQAKRAA